MTTPPVFLKSIFPIAKKWLFLPSELEAFDQILWSDSQQLLAILLEGEIEIWHHRGPGVWHCCHHISQVAFFNGMAFSESAPELLTLDNEGHFKRWSIDLEHSHTPPDQPKRLHHAELSHWGPEAEDRVVSFSAESSLIALGYCDEPEVSGDGSTGRLCYTLLACVNNAGTETELAVVI